MEHTDKSVTSQGRMPVVFLPHGGGPWPFVKIGFGTPDEISDLSSYLKSVSNLTAQKPKALLVVSAHWEEKIPTVMTSAAPPMFYDYYGFPPDSYKIQWPAPGDPALAAHVRELLGAAGFESGENPERGYDHGTFVPLKLTYPDADIPVVQLSILSSLDPARHIALGRALAPLRDEGVLIIGSGMTFHDLRSFGPRGMEASERFDLWLRESVILEEEQRNSRLLNWAKAPSARQSHPREEHLLPLMVIAGAAGEDRGVVAWNGTFNQIRLSAYHFGV